MTATPITNQVEIDATDPELLEDRWRSALKSHIDPFAVLELVTDESGAPVDLRYVEANPAAIAYHDTTADDLLGHTMLEFYPGLSTDGPLTRYLRTAITGEPVIFDDYPYFNELKGETRWYDLRAVQCGNGIALTWRDATDRHNVAVELARSEEQFRLLVSNMYGVVLLSVNSRVQWISPAVGGLLGMSAEEMSGATTTHLWHPDDRERAIALQGRAYAGHTATDVLRIHHAQGHSLSVEVSVAPYSSDEFLHGAVIYMRDVTDKVAAEVALAEREALYRILAENAMDLILSTDAGGTVLWASPSVQAVLGYRPGELAGQGLSMIIHPDDVGMLRLSIDESPQGHGTTSRARFVTKDGNPRWMEATRRVAHDLHRKAAAVVIAVRDIDEQVRTEIALERELHFDSLTGLAKRELALLRTREILDGLRGRSWAVLCVGVNGLTAINHAHTYAAGDLVLQTVADRLVSATGAHDRVARVTGDEFAILLTDVVTSHDAALAAERLLAAIRGQMPWDGERIEISGYVGIALTRPGPTSRDAEDLLRDASAAMRRAAGKGPESFDFLDGNIAAQAREALTLRSSLRDAIAGRELVPWFMPLVELESGEVIGYESLVRWEHPDGSIRTPDAFLSAAESSGLIAEIDQLMLSTTLEVAASAPKFAFSINVSAASLQSSRLLHHVQSELRRTQVDPTRIHLEVTETALFHVTNDVKSTMSTLAELGISWWVDDFGTGYSSITHLRDLPIAGLKLDKSFTNNLSLTDDHASRLAHGLIGLAHGLGLATVAEGVETREQVDVLLGQGWTYGQGWHFGKARPLPLE